MKQTSFDTQQIQEHLYSLLIPKEIMSDFSITKVEEMNELLVIELVEKKEKILNFDQHATLVLNGYLNPIEIQNFPVTGKVCILKLIRRRWKVQGTKEVNFFNDYSYTIEGTKVTPKFGAFLKEIGL